jgi:hypothetical protein
MSTPVPSTPATGPGWDRRTLLKTGVAAAAVAGGPFAGFVSSASASVFTADPTADLVPVPDERDGVVRLRLPEGFSYRSFHDTSVAGGSPWRTAPGFPAATTAWAPSCTTTGPSRWCATTR